jgi:hypothetical protein
MGDEQETLRFPLPFNPRDDVVPFRKNFLRLHINPVSPTKRRHESPALGLPRAVRLTRWIDAVDRDKVFKCFDC